MLHWGRLLGIAVATARSVRAAATPLTCPLEIPATTLTMDCSAHCPNALSPCLYHTKAESCKAAVEAEGSMGSACVEGTGGCAVECLSPFSGAAEKPMSAWNLILTDQGEYKVDVQNRLARDPGFHVAKKPAAQVTKIDSLEFPFTAKTISITGNALPIIDKFVDYPVVFHGSVVSVDLNGFDFLGKAKDATVLILENLDLSALTMFPKLELLEELQLSNGMLIKVPMGIGDLPALKRLDLSLNNVVTIEAKSLPPTLTELNIQDSGLGIVPSDILLMSDLRKLDLSGNKFPLPPAGSLPLGIEKLAWWGLYHKKLPADFSKMTKLKILEMGWNDFSNSATLASLPTSIEELHLRQTLLKEVPPSFAQLPSLHWLDVSYNAIQNVTVTTLPSSLKFLNLSVNWIDHIDSDALPLRIETLDLSVNILNESSLPENLSQYKKLATLYLNDNAFKTIPPTVFTLPGLKNLTLHNSPNMSHVTLSESQVSYLNALSNLTVDAKVFESNCDQPLHLSIVNVNVCRIGDPTITVVDKPTTGDKAQSKGNSALIIGIGASLGGLLVILIGIVQWRRRRPTTVNHNSAILQYPDDPSKHDIYVIDEDDLRDLDSILESSQATEYSEMPSANTSVDLSSKKSRMTVASGEGVYSIWEDEELLQWRLDVLAVKEIEMIASGMYGEVWLGTYMNQHVVLKRLRRHASGGTPYQQQQDVDDRLSLSTGRQRSEVQQFIQEIRFHIRFEHPKIVTFIGVTWTMESDIQAVVEYMPMGDLRTYLATLTPKIVPVDADDETDDDLPHHWDEVAWGVALDVIEALVYLHSLDPPVLHRDLKSRNVLLNGDCQAKLSDFGVSRYHHDDDADVLMTVGVGTARWMAPEVLMGQENYTSAVDIYSFGVILSELDTWSLPFAEQSLNETALLSKIAVGELQPRFRVRKSPPEIVALGQRCLAYDPRARLTAVEVAFQLRQGLERLRVRKEFAADSVVEGLGEAFSEYSSRRSNQAVRYE